jgi:lysophospholipase L1-like esterase
MKKFLYFTGAKTFSNLLTFCLGMIVLWLPVSNIKIIAEDKNDNWKPTAIFALSGQSNMSGAALSADIPKEFTVFPKNVRMWESGNWVEIKLGEKYGPEIGFAFEMSKKMPKQNIGLVKLGISGAGIVSWVGEGNPPKDKNEYEYGQAFEAWTSMVKKAMKSAPNANLMGVLWMQGETDANKKELAEKYKANLQKLIKAFRKEVSSDNLPFLIGKIQAKKFLFLKEVWKAQEETAKEIPHTVLVNTDSIELNKDNLHFSAKGQIDLGKAFATEFLKMSAGRQKTKR